MNGTQICRLLGIVVLFIGAAMSLSLPWALPVFGQVDQIDLRSLVGLFGAMLVCAGVGGVLMWIGREQKGKTIFRREAIAVVGLSWILAMVLGAFPFWLSQTCIARDVDGGLIPMGIADGLFESASGFSGTGATVLSNLEDSEMVPRAILFWRSETHFLGGLGIMVLFVAVLGMGSAGKALMLTEMPGPNQETSEARSQRAARSFAALFIGLTIILSIILALEGMTVFDAMAHAFGTIATGGFSTHNKSIEFFHSPMIDYTLTLFMAIACTNFTLLYYVILWRPKKLFEDLEFRAYLTIMGAVVVLVIIFGLLAHDFTGPADALRYGSFQVVSIMTNTGFGTADFDQWNSFSRGLLFLLMFVGGCAGSTSCSVKVIRYLLLSKVLKLELEQIYHPNVVRHIRLGDRVIPDTALRKDVLLFFTIVLCVFVAGWMLLVAFEPDETWTALGHSPEHKLIDCASAVAATVNGVGPGLGIVGESENYGHFHWPSKCILSGMMLLGRLEFFILIVLFWPRFWRR